MKKLKQLFVHFFRLIKKSNKMRTLFLTFLAFITLSSLSFAQESIKFATAQSKADLAISKESGIYVFVLPKGITQEEVIKNSKYYLHYFTVEFSEKTNEAKIVMVSNDEKSRHVIIRFLTACGAQNIIVDGRTMPNEEFFVTFIK